NTSHFSQQNARGAALLRVQTILSPQRGRIFRELLRLLSAGSVHSALRYLHREGFVDQRGNREAATLDSERVTLATRCDGGRYRVMHLRRYFTGRLRANGPQGK